MIIAISGSRSYNDYNTFCSILNNYKHIVTSFQVGDATGVDSMTIRFCKENNIPYVSFKADWKLYGKGAGPIRNQSIINGSSLLIAIPTHDSKGTLDAIKKAEKLSIRVHRYDV